MVISDGFDLGYSKEKWQKIRTIKRSGILTPLFSVHSSDSTGIGDFADLNLLIDLCVKTKNTILQILPLSYTGSDNCPYNAVSSFAMDPVYISLSHFLYRGKSFSKNTIKFLQSRFVAGKNNRCDYSVRNTKLNLLKEFFELNFEQICSDSEFFHFTHLTEYWLDDFAVYLVLKEINNGTEWYQWDRPFMEKSMSVIDKIKNIKSKEILFHKWVQFICYKQLCEVREYAKTNKVLIMGDLPVLTAKDSADVWSKNELFNLKFVSGAPPDMYSAYGQRWGMPLYNRENLRANGFQYIVEKLKYLSIFFDIVRIDHVVGLFRIWAIPEDEPQENHGMNGFFIPEDESIWKEHGREILTVMINGFEGLLCAEDLGVIPSVCPEVLKELGIPGYEIQRWKKNYDTDCSFVQAEKYRHFAISSLSTHDTSFWIDWYRNEAGTIDIELFLLKCKLHNFVPDKIINKLFDKNSVHGRLKWKEEINTETKVLETIGLVEEKARDILQIYRETFQEKEKVENLLGINDSNCIKKAIRFILRTSSIFSINLLADLLCLDPKIASEITGLRINKPGTTGPHNWSFAFNESIEQILEMKLIDEIREMVEESKR